MKFQNNKKSIEIVSVKTVEEVLKHALTKELKPVKWVEIDQVSNKIKKNQKLQALINCLKSLNKHIFIDNKK